MVSLEFKEPFSSPFTLSFSQLGNKFSFFVRFLQIQLEVEFNEGCSFSFGLPTVSFFQRMRSHEVL